MGYILLQLSSISWAKWRPTRHLLLFYCERIRDSNISGTRQRRTFRAFKLLPSPRVVVEEEERGTSKRFTCQFHRWTYDSNGTLVGLPKAEHFGELESERKGLIELPSEERHGLLWVHPDPSGVIDIGEMLTDNLIEELESWDLHELEHLEMIRTT